MWSARDILTGTSKFLYVRSEGAGGGKAKGEAYGLHGAWERIHLSQLTRPLTQACDLG